MKKSICDKVIARREDWTSSQVMRELLVWLQHRLCTASMRTSSHYVPLVDVVADMCLRFHEEITTDEVCWLLAASVNRQEGLLSEDCPEVPCMVMVGYTTRAPLASEENYQVMNQGRVCHRMENSEEMMPDPMFAQGFVKIRTNGSAVLRCSGVQPVTTWPSNYFRTENVDMYATIVAVKPIITQTDRLEQKRGMRSQDVTMALNPTITMQGTSGQSSLSRSLCLLTLAASNQQTSSAVISA